MHSYSMKRHINVEKVNKMLQLCISINALVKEPRLLYINVYIFELVFLMIFFIIVIRCLVFISSTYNFFTVVNFNPENILHIFFYF